MSVTVLVPSPLRQFTGGVHAVRTAGLTVAAVLDNLVAAHPGLRAGILDSTGGLQPFIRVFVNSRDIAAQAGLDTPVADGSEVLILQAISGG